MRRSLFAAVGVAACCLGVVHLASATGSPGELGRHATAQALYAVLGLIAFTIVSRVDHATLRRWSWPAWGAGVVLLVAVMFSGHVGGGARSWLDLGPVNLQPSELMKVLLPLVLATELRRPDRERWRQLGRVALAMGGPLGLIAAQPDMGAVGLIGIACAAVLWLAGLPRWLYGVGVAGVSVGLPLVWSFGLEDYQRRRVFTFLAPEQDPSGAGYQVLQSRYAIGSGGLWGRGFGASTQGRLGFLPEHETDFIFPVLGEAFGFVGAIAVVGLLAAVVLLGLEAAERARTPFGALLAGGLSLGLLGQVLVNLGGVLGLLPLTGVTLPFFSYGGSSLMVVWTTLGLLAGVAATAPQASTQLSPVEGAQRPAPPRLLPLR